MYCHFDLFLLAVFRPFNCVVVVVVVFQALKTYEAEPNSTEVGKMEKNARKNRYSDVLPCEFPHFPLHLIFLHFQVGCLMPYHAAILDPSLI